jgi:Family of unknown function (DUF5706)
MSITSFHQQAASYLLKYYEDSSEDGVLFTYRFLEQFAVEAIDIARHADLEGMDLENAIVATWFRYAGVRDIGSGQTEEMKKLLEEYFILVGYPMNDKAVVREAIDTVVGNKYADTPVKQVVSDAVNSQLGSPDFLENVILIRKELDDEKSGKRSELYYLEYFLSLFIRERYYSTYASEKYARIRQRNFEYVQKRIKDIKDDIHKEKKSKNKQELPAFLTNKETEDLFKLAFRNYNHLISVADSKASLLIKVNSVIISVMIAFVLGKIGKSLFILWPTIILLVVCLLTILMAILASRPQSNSFLEDRKSHSFQRFFFGSFDMVDPSFLQIKWEEYYQQLTDLFTNSKETVYLEIYKESFNVRKVLSRKFNYLARAYWIFLFGLLVSVISFVVAIYNHA